MRFSTLLSGGAMMVMVWSGKGLPQPGSPFQVPVPWTVSDLSVYNIRHGTGGWWTFTIADSPTLPPQGFNTTCSYYGPASYFFAYDDPPYNAPCKNTNVTFGMYPSEGGFVFNVTHLWGDCGSVNTAKTREHSKPCVDNGTWLFSYNDVSGQERDVQNNFGQWGTFTHPSFNMYPKRAKESLKCEFC